MHETEIKFASTFEKKGSGVNIYDKQIHLLSFHSYEEYMILSYIAYKSASFNL